MSYPWTVYKTWVTGEVLTASDLNQSLQTVITNSVPASIDDTSTNLAAMQVTRDPYPAASPSLAVTLAEEVQSLRYVMAQITGQAQWYIDPTTDLTLLAPKAGPTFTGTATFATVDVNTLFKGKGTVSADSADAGDIGEYVESNQTATVNAPTSTQLGDLTSISLTAGDWDVTGNVSWTENGSTTTVVEGGISVTTGNSATGLTYGVNRFQAEPATAAHDINIPVTSYRINVSSTTTVYLKFSATFSAGTPKAYGSIRARRRR